MADEPPFNSRLVGVLGRFGLASGAYADETPCSMDWVMVDAEAVTEAVRRGSDPVVALIDTGFWLDESRPLPPTFRADLLAACNG
jgi:hypothetical protein